MASVVYATDNAPSRKNSAVWRLPCHQDTVPQPGRQADFSIDFSVIY
jgi:hypothetical protein